LLVSICIASLHDNDQFRNAVNFVMISVAFDLYQEARNYITEILTVLLALSGYAGIFIPLL